MYVMVTALAVLKPRKSVIHKYRNLKYRMFIYLFFFQFDWQYWHKNSGVE